mmetsp:Transcript_10794/g.16439  ORF Transcript_10794/g.16439 Transcript_10794/m.16439 type:complete len:114 (-) Transcript_10794:286-627(-)
MFSQPLQVPTMHPLTASILANTSSSSSTASTAPTASTRRDKLSRNGNVAHHTNESRKNQNSKDVISCVESYRLFKRCSTMNGDTEGFSCSAAVKMYMNCALDGCLRLETNRDR